MRVLSSCLLLILLAVVVFAQKCLVPGTIAGKCVQCGIGYDLATIKQFDASFDEDECVQVTEDVSPANFYVSTSCTTGCDGTNEKPFPNIIAALRKIPMPPATQSIIPTFTLLLKDQDNYILAAHTNNVVTFYNKRKLINLVIRPDPATRFTSMPTIYIKTQLFSIFVSSQTTLQGLRISGIGLNEAPASFANAASITCTPNIQKLPFDAPQGIQGSSIQIRCGVAKFQTGASPQAESYGVFTVEPMFDLATKIVPQLVIRGCFIENFYALGSPRFNTFAKANLLLPSFISIQETNITNIYFDQGFISSLEPKSTLFSYIPKSESLSEKYNRYRATTPFQVRYQTNLISQYNDYRVSHFENNHKLTGALVSMADHQLDLNLTKVTINNVNITDLKWFDFRNTKINMDDGISYGHYHLVTYTSTQLILDLNNIPMMSHLNVDQVSLTGVGINNAFKFHPTTSQEYFFKPDKVHSKVDLFNLRCVDSWIRFIMIWSNADFTAKNNHIENVAFNFGYFATIFHQFDFLNSMTVENSNFYNLHNLQFIDDDINEINCLLYYDNLTATEYHPSSVTIRTSQFINISDMVIFEGRNQYPDNFYFLNNKIRNHNRVELAWSMLGAFFRENVRVEGIELESLYNWEFINNKQIARKVEVTDIKAKDVYLGSLVTFRGSVRFVQNWTLTVTNIQWNDDPAQCYKKDLGYRSLVADNARREDTSVLKQLGTLTIQNSTIYTCSAQEYSQNLFFQQSPYNKNIRNLQLSYTGPGNINRRDYVYTTPIVEYLNITNCTISRSFYTRLNVTSPEWQAVKQLQENVLLIDNHNVFIQDSVFIDLGYTFTKITLSLLQITQLKNVTFSNVGLVILSPRQKVELEQITMYSYNRNESSTYFIKLENTEASVSNNAGEINNGLQNAQLIISNSKFYGNLSEGCIQLTNVKMYVENSLFETQDRYLQDLIKNNQEIPKNLQPPASLIILRQNGWLYAQNVTFSKCSSSTSVKRSCIEAFQSAIVEINESTFIDSQSSFGAHIYGYGIKLYLTDTKIKKGVANKGGLIYIIGSQLSMIGGSLEDGTAIYNGGQIYGEKSSIAIRKTKLLNGQSLDTGASIYGINLQNLLLEETDFQDMTSKVQGVIYSKSNSKDQQINLVKVKLTNCTSLTRSASIYMEGSKINITDLRLEKNYIKADMGKQEDFMSLLSFHETKLTLKQITILNSESVDYLFLSQVTGSIQEINITNSFFHGKSINIYSSDIAIERFNYIYPSDDVLISSLKTINRFTFNPYYRLTLLHAQSSQVQISNSVFPLLSIVSILSGQESDSAIMEVSSGIRAENSEIRSSTSEFRNRYIITDEQFVTPSLRRMLTAHDVQEMLFETQAKAIHIDSGRIFLLKTVLPTFAIASPIISLSNSQFNLTQVQNENISLSSKSILDSFCLGTEKNKCQFLDLFVKLSADQNLEGFYLIQNSTFKSYGTTFNFTAEPKSPTVKLTNIELLSRQGQAAEIPMAIKSTTLEIRNITVANYDLPLEITQGSRVTITNGVIKGQRNGAVKTIDSKLEIDGVLFQSNVAQSGGAIYASCSDPQVSAIQIRNCRFKDNNATESGGAIRNIECPLVDINNTYINNKAQFGNDFLGYPDSVVLHQIIQMSGQSIVDLASLAFKTTTKELSDGNMHNQTLYVVGGEKVAFVINVIDNFDQIYPLGSYFLEKTLKQVIDSAESSVKVIFQTNDEEIKVSLVKYSFELLNNAIIIEEFYVYAKENYVGKDGKNFLEIFISGSSLGKIQLVILPCPQGSISTSDRCFLCPQDTYSLNPQAEKCENCDRFQICNGRNYLFAEPGFYISPNTSIPQPCPVMDGCLHEVIENVVLDKIFWIRHFKKQLSTEVFNEIQPFLLANEVALEQATQESYCANGYQGTFCVICEENYGQTSDGLCFQCNEDATIYIRFFISSFIVFALTYKDSIEPLLPEVEGEPELSGSLIKQLTDFTQFINVVVGMISNVQPEMLPALAILTDQLSLFPSDFDSAFDCFLLSGLSDPFQRYKYRLLIGSLIPWGYIVIMILIILAIDKVKIYFKKESIPAHVTLMDVIIVTMVANLYNFYFYLAQLCLMVFSCMKVEDPEAELGYRKVMSVMTEIECWQQDHLILILSYGLPTLIFYVIGIPIMFIIFIAKYYQPPEEEDHKNDSNNAQINQNQEHESFLMNQDEQNPELQSNVQSLRFKDVVQLKLKAKSNDRQSSVALKDSVQYEKQSVINKAVIQEESNSKNQNSKLNTSKSSKEAKQVNYSVFLTENLKPQFKYWDIYVQIKKLLIIIIMILTYDLNVQTVSIVVLIVFISFMLISYRYQPYQQNTLNDYESGIDLVLTVVIHLSLLIIQTQTVGLQIFAIILIILFKFVFYFYALKVIVSEYLEYFKSSGSRETKKI